MAVDANILIYDRIREEMDNGRNIKQSAVNGFELLAPAFAPSSLPADLTGGTGVDGGRFSGSTFTPAGGTSPYTQRPRASFHLYCWALAAAATSARLNPITYRYDAFMPAPAIPRRRRAACASDDTRTVTTFAPLVNAPDAPQQALAYNAFLRER